MEPASVGQAFPALLAALQTGGPQAAASARSASDVAPAPTVPNAPAMTPGAASAVAFRGSLVRQVRALLEAAGADQITGSGIAPPGTSDPPPGPPAAGPVRRMGLVDGGSTPGQAAVDATGTSKEGARPLAAVSAYRNLSASTEFLLSRSGITLERDAAGGVMATPAGPRDPMTVSRAAAAAVLPVPDLRPAAAAPPSPSPAAAATAGSAIAADLPGATTPFVVAASARTVAAAPLSVPPTMTVPQPPVTRADVAPVAPAGAPPSVAGPRVVRVGAPSAAPAGPGAATGRAAVLPAGVEVAVAPPAVVASSVAAGVAEPAAAGPAGLLWSPLSALTRREPGTEGTDGADAALLAGQLPAAPAGHAAGVPAAAATPGQAALTQLAAEAARTAPGTTRELALTLSTPELGRLRVRLVVGRGGAVRVELRAANEQAAAVLRNDLPHLARSLEAQGLQLGAAQVAVSTAAFGGFDSPGQPRQQPRWFEHRGGRAAAGPEEAAGAVGAGAYARRLTAVDLLA